LKEIIFKPIDLFVSGTACSFFARYLEKRATEAEKKELMDRIHEQVPEAELQEFIDASYRMSDTFREILHEAALEAEVDNE